MSSKTVQLNGYNDSSKPCNIQTEFEEVKIPVPWGHIAGKWWGPTNTQPVLAIHGWQDNAGTFDTLAPLLVSEGISLLCIDLPGHGFSSHFPKGVCYYVFWDGIHLVRRIVKYYNWETVTILGHSLGGGIAFLYASTYPSEVVKYISIDIAAPIVRETSKALKYLGSNIDKLLKFENLKKENQPCYDYEEMLGIVVDAYKGGCTRESCEILMKRGMQPQDVESDFDEEAYTFSRDVRLKVPGWAMMSLQQALEFASTITCEVLNIRADPGMSFDKPEFYKGVVDKISETAKRAEFFLVPGTHHVHLNNPERISGVIATFLKS